jgi:glycerol-3-phosphate acyltransferase PlsY
VNEFNFSNPKALARSVGYSLVLLGLLSGIVGVVWSAGIVTLTSVVAPFLIMTLMAMPCLYLIHLNSGKATNDS